MQQSKFTMLLLLTNGKSVLVLCLLFDILLLSLTLCVFWCCSSLQLQTLKAAAFAILANSDDSRSFWFAPEPVEGGSEGHKVTSRGSPPLSGSRKLLNQLSWLLSQSSEAASSIVSAFPPYSFDVSLHRITRILLSKIPSWIHTMRICLLILISFLN